MTRSVIAIDGTKKNVLGFQGVNVQIRQIMQDYHGLNPKKMDLWEIRFYYNPLIPSIIESQNLAKKSKHGK